MPTEHLMFFETLAPFARTPEVVCVHAGISEEYVSVESESEATLVWGAPDWWRGYNGEDKIVYGHWDNASRTGGRARPFVLNETYGIDCVASDQLIAIRFPNLSILSAT